MKKINNSKQYIIIAFDFDQTISKISVPSELFMFYGIIHFTEITDDTIDKFIDKVGLTNIISEPFFDKTFINYLRMIKQQHNVKIVVTSFGINSAIKRILDRINVLDIFDSILTPSSFGLVDAVEYFDMLDGKNQMIEPIQKEYNVNNSNVLLIDDHKENIRRAIKKGYVTSFVPKRVGVTK